MSKRVFYARHFKIMSRHKTKLNGEKLCRDKEILCRDIFQEQQRMKCCCNKVFMLQHKTLMSRQLQVNFNRILSRHFQIMSRHNSRKRHETMSQPKTASHDKAGKQRWFGLCRNIIFQCRDKATYWPKFLGIHNFNLEVWLDLSNRSGRPFWPMAWPEKRWARPAWPSTVAG